MMPAVMRAGTATVNRYYCDHSSSVVAPNYRITREAVVAESLCDLFGHAIETTVIVGEALDIGVLKYLVEKLAGNTALIHTQAGVFRKMRAHG
jgi:hypothetical protein